MVRYVLTLKEKILKYLIEDKDRFNSVLEISKNIKADYKNTFNAINKIDDKIISKYKLGNRNIIKFWFNFNEDVYSIEKKRRNMFFGINSEIEIIRKDVENLNYPFMIVLIFGSRVKGDFSKNSDIDVCVISDNKLKVKELISQLNLLPLKIEVHSFASKEFVLMLNSRLGNIAHEIVKNNIIVYGIENYYNIMPKWMKKE